MGSRPLGQTGLEVTRLGLGLAAVGRPAYLNLGRSRDLGPDRGVARLEQRTHRLLDAAWRAGVRYVDTARSYGRAEAFLSSWLRQRGLAAGALTVGTKWGYEYVGGWQVHAEVHEIKDHSLGMLRRQVAESRELLGDHLALLQIHSATPETGVLEDRRVLEELGEVRAQGLVIGLTVSGPTQAETVRRALEAQVDGENPFQCVQATWNLLERSTGDALAEAHAAGWGVIVKEALANGRLAVPARVPWLLASLADRHRLGLDAVALAVVLGQP
ncbi:MAG: aldo/keto reductase, partial [Actinomycetota bacterium]|nr:aldo/keto reductase [Actinomycetota bacterium]